MALPARLTFLTKVFQCIGGTAFVTAAQSAFVNTLIQKLPTAAPDVDPAKVVVTGATAIRVVFPAEQVAGIVESYMAGIKVALAMAIGGAGVGLLIALWNIKGGKLGGGKGKEAVVAV